MRITARDHAEQRQDAENGHKPERLPEISSIATIPISPIGTTLNTPLRPLCEKYIVAYGVRYRSAWAEYLVSGEISD
jgi:hypothetical protein